MFVLRQGNLILPPMREGRIHLGHAGSQNVYTSAVHHPWFPSKLVENQSRTCPDKGSSLKQGSGMASLGARFFAQLFYRYVFTWKMPEVR